MKTITLITILFSVITMNSLTQIQMESLNLELPHIHSKNNNFFSESGPLMIVEIDSIEYILDSLSYNNIDADWIKSVTVFKDSKTTELYGCKGEDGVVIIRLLKNHEEDFLKGKPASNPLKSRKDTSQF